MLTYTPSPRNNFWKEIVIVGTGILLSSAACAADTYKVDPAHSHIGFAVKHMMVANVVGHFSRFEGTIVFDAKALSQSSAKASIQTNSIDTGLEARDKDLKSPNFLDSQRFPTITFSTKNIAGQGEQYIMVGDLTIKGVTKEVSIPVTISGPVKNPMGGYNIGLVGQVTIKRQDYGITWNKTLDNNGGFMVGDEVKIDLNIEAKKE